MYFLILFNTNFITSMEPASEKKTRNYLLVFGNVSKKQLSNIGCLILLLSRVQSYYI